MDRHYATNVDFRRQRQIDRERETEGERKRERSILRGVDVFICMIIDDTQSMWSCQKLGCFFASEKPSTRLRCRVRNTWVVLCHKHICEFLNRRVRNTVVFSRQKQVRGVVSETRRLFCVRNTVVFSCQKHGCGFVSETRFVVTDIKHGQYIHNDMGSTESMWSCQKHGCFSRQKHQLHV